jgi:hypothetical protein
MYGLCTTGLRPAARLKVLLKQSTNTGAHIAAASCLILRKTNFAYIEAASFFVCSRVRNMMTFQEPRRPKLGTKPL